MVPIHGQPLLGWWFTLLQRHRVTDALVNTHYLPDAVRRYMEEYNRRNTGLVVHETYEPELLGSGGTIRANWDFIQHEKDFLICYADNLTDANLTEFRQFHREHRGPLSMALFRTGLPRQCGIAELDEESRIVNFVEKPERPKSDLANAGIYIADRRVFPYLDQDKPLLDLGKDVLPKLIGNMYGWHTDGYLIDIGTLESYKKANEEWMYDYHENTPADQLYRRRD